jgi:hypothetical protein
MINQIKGNALKWAIRNRDILEVKGKVNEVGVGLFSISNERNRITPGWIDSWDSLIFNAPIEEILKMWPEDYYWIQDDDGVMKQVTRREKFYDKPISTYEQGGKMGGASFWNCNDYIVWMMSKVEDDVGYDTWDWSHPLNSLWGFWMHGKMTPNTKWQNWINTQTHWTRLLSSLVRKVYGLDDDSLHRARGIALQKYSDTTELVVDERVTGSIILNGAKYYVAVSGHLINLILTSFITGMVDVNRYVDTIEFNVMYYSGGLSSVERKAYQRALDKGDIFEKEGNSSRRLWHSYTEWIVALPAAEILAKELGFKLKRGPLEMIKGRLGSILRKYPKFNDEGYQALSYRREGSRS